MWICFLLLLQAITTDILIFHIVCLLIIFHSQSYQLDYFSGLCSYPQSQNSGVRGTIIAVIFESSLGYRVKPYVNKKKRERKRRKKEEEKEKDEEEKEKGEEQRSR